MAPSARDTEERKTCIKIVQRLSKKLHADGFLGIMLGYTGSGDEGSAGNTVACKSAKMPKLTEQLVWDDDATAAFEDPVRTALLTEYEFARTNHYDTWLRDNATAAELQLFIGRQSGVYPTIDALLKALLFAFIPWGYEENDGGAGILFLNTETGEVFTQLGSYATVLNVAPPVQFNLKAPDGVICKRKSARRRHL